MIKPTNRILQGSAFKKIHVRCNSVVYGTCIKYAGLNPKPFMRNDSP